MKNKDIKTEGTNRTITVRFYPFVSTGKERDEETGYGYFGARYMDHELMTMWLSVDPLVDKYPSISPYNYCMLNPVRVIDPDGNEVMENDDEWKIDKQKRTITRVNLNGGDFIQYVNGDTNPIRNNTSRGELLNEYSGYVFIDNAPVLMQLNPSEERAKTEAHFLNPIAGTLVGGTGLGCEKMSKAIYDLENGTYMGKDGSTKTMKKGKNGGLGGRYKAQEKTSAKYAKAGRVCTILNISSTLISVRNTESQYRNGEISQVKRWMNHAIDAIGCTTIGCLAPLAYELGQHHGPSTWF